MTEVRVIPLRGIPEVAPGDDLAALLIDALARPGIEPDDVLVVTHKVVSKAEGRLLPEEQRSEAVARESVRVLRRQGDMTISETKHGFVCANAGIDASNVAKGEIALLPIDPDASARRLRSRVLASTGIDLAVVISDTFGRAWRLGQTDVAIGVAGMDPFVDYRGSRDAAGRDLAATRIAVADEIAGAAELVMGKSTGVCAAIVRGATVRRARGAATALIRRSSDDLFR